MEQTAGKANICPSTPEGLQHGRMFLSHDPKGYRMGEFVPYGSKGRLIATVCPFLSCLKRIKTYRKSIKFNPQNAKFSPGGLPPPEPPAKAVSEFKKEITHTHSDRLF